LHLTDIQYPVSVFSNVEGSSCQLWAMLCPLTLTLSREGERGLLWLSREGERGLLWLSREGERGP